MVACGCFDWLSGCLWVLGLVGLAKWLPVRVWVGYVVAGGCLVWLSACLWVFGLAKWLLVGVWVG